MTRVRRTIGLLAASMMLIAQAATPGLAIARNSLPAWACSPADIAAASGGTARNPLTDATGRLRELDTGQVAKDLPASAKGKAPANFEATVPVIFHVITDGALGNLTDKQLRDQIKVLNVTYGGGEGGFDSGFSFTLAGVTRTDDATWYASKSGGAERQMKKALKQGGDNTLNVYTTSGGAYLGWAYLPDITDTNQAYLDGIVMDWRTVPGASTEYAGRYDQGETLTHETGHWLNLEHTFYGGCNATGDFVDDTPSEKTATSGCPVGKDTCPAPGADPIHNYMDYSYDQCYTEFTAGQAQRMHDAWLFYRAP
jgi:Pregnancy-associated plasma protein-A